METALITELANKVTEFTANQVEINGLLTASGGKTVDQINSLIDIANRHSDSVNSLVGAINTLTERVAKLEGIVGAYCEAKGDGELLKYLLQLDDLRQAEEDAKVVGGEAEMPTVVPFVVPTSGRTN
jgi:hypothetical protein